MGKPACHKKTKKIYNDYEYIVHTTNDRLKGLNTARLLIDSKKRKTDKYGSLYGKGIIINEIPLRLACLKTSKFEWYFE